MFVKLLLIIEQYFEFLEELVDRKESDAQLLDLLSLHGLVLAPLELLLQLGAEVNHELVEVEDRHRDVDKEVLNGVRMKMLLQNLKQIEGLFDTFI